MEFVSDPVLAFFTISFCAFAYSSVSNFLIRKLGNRKRLKKIQQEINHINKEAVEAAKEGKEAQHKPGETAHSHTFSLVQESLILQFKPLLVSLVFFFGFTSGLKMLFPKFEVVLAISLPIFIQNFEKFPNWRDTFGVVGWFIIATILGSFVIQSIADKFLPEPDLVIPDHPHAHAHPHKHE